MAKQWPLWLAALLYGMLLPASKIILNEGIGILAFSLLAVLIRLGVDLPVALSGSLKVRSARMFWILIGLGMTGAFMTIGTFYCLDQGISVSLLVILMSSHPVFTFILSRIFNLQESDRFDVIKIISALLGIFTIVGGVQAFNHSWLLLFAPLGVSLVISIWVCLSNLASKEGAEPQAISFYYNLFSLLVLVGISLIQNQGQDFREAFLFVDSVPHLLQILTYSLVLSSLPNYLFYFESKYVPAVTAGMILLLEPVISSFISCLIWHDTLTSRFFMGAACILFANLPLSSLLGNLPKSFFFKRWLFRSS